MEPTTNQEVITPEPSAPTDNKKEGNGLKAATIICAVLALAGIGFGVYGMMRKPVETPTEDNAAELEAELSNVKQKYAVLQNYVKELEASGTEVPEEAKSATETTIATSNPVIINTKVKDSQHVDYAETYSIRTTGSAYVNGATKYWILSSANGNLLCKIADQEYESTDNAENCDMAAHDGKVSGIYYTHIGNGGGSYMLILTEDGSVEYLSDLQGEQFNAIKKLSLPSKVTYIYPNVDACSSTSEGVFGGCGKTALLVYADGSIVDLYDIAISE